MARKKAAPAPDADVQALEKPEAWNDTPVSEMPAEELVRAAGGRPLPGEAAEKADLLEYPDEDAPALCTVQPGTHLEIIGEDGRWSMVCFGEVRGWIPRGAVRR